MSLGSVGALIEFVASEVAQRSYFLTGSLNLGSLLGNSTANFKSGSTAEGVMGTVTGWLSAIHANFSLGPLLSLSQPCLPSGSIQIDFVPIAFRPPLPLFHVFKFSCQKQSNNCRETIKYAPTLLYAPSEWMFWAFLHEMMKNEDDTTENKGRFVFDLLFDIVQKDGKTVLLPLCGTKYSKKRNNLCTLNWCYFVSTAVRWCDCAASSQQLYFYEQSQWKAHLCLYPGSGDSSPLARHKNRYRTQTICSPERPGGTRVQMSLAAFELSLALQRKSPQLSPCLGLQEAPCDFCPFSIGPWLWLWWHNRSNAKASAIERTWRWLKEGVI